LKLKLIGFIVFAILTTVAAQHIFTIPLIKAYFIKKAFEVSTTTIERIADFSSFALLERTYENRLSLHDATQTIWESRIEGLVGGAIYQREKKEARQIRFEYLDGFGLDREKTPMDEPLMHTLEEATDAAVIRESHTLKRHAQVLDTYRFVKPIFYAYQGQNVLLGAVVLYYDKHAINTIVEQLLKRIFMITLMTLFGAIVVIYLIGSSFVRPIMKITKAATEVARGNLEVDLQVRTNDEIEQLADQFNVMVGGLRERQKMQKFVSNSTIDMIQDGLACTPVLGGEYRKLTLLFSDIRGFTALSESVEPSEVVRIINFYLDLQSKIIKENGGDIDKFIGDEVMASFSGPDAAQKALRCAVEIQRSIRRANQRKASANDTVCEVGIGINEGDVVVGNIGSHERMDFTSIGMAVNVASRLCSCAKAGEIIVEKSTFDASGSSYMTKTIEPISAKGISYKVAVYTIDY
jgi:class 3 adenylate cyclase